MTIDHAANEARFSAEHPARQEFWQNQAQAHLLYGHTFGCDCPNYALSEVEVVRRTAYGLPACSPQWEKYVIDTIEGVVIAQAAAKREKDRITRIMNRKDGGQFRGGVDG